MVKICENGKLRLKKKSDIAPGWPKAGGGERFDKKFFMFRIKNLSFLVDCWSLRLLGDDQYNTILEPICTIKTLITTVVQSVSGMERSSVTELLLKICTGGGSSLSAAREE